MWGNKYLENLLKPIINVPSETAKMKVHIMKTNFTFKIHNDPTL